MTKSVDKSTIVFLVIFCILIMAAAVVGGQYAGGLLFAKLQALPRESVTPLTLIRYWGEYSDVRLVKKHLTFGFLLAAGIPLAVGGMGGMMLFAGNRRSLHGDARWAHAAEILKAGLFSKEGKDGWPAIVVGKFKGKFLQFFGQQFVALAAPTRSGKGVGIVIPNYLSYSHSIVGFDPKLENWSITAGFRASCGQECYLFAPDSPKFETHRYNPLSYVRRDKIYRVDDIQGIGNILYASSGADANSKFFNEMAQTLFLGLVLYMLDTPGEEVSLPNLVRLTAPASGQPLHEWIGTVIEEREEAGQPLSNECINALMSFAGNSENTRAGIKASLEAPLNIFRSPLVAAATSGDDFDLRDVRKKPMSIYFGLQPNSIERFERLTNLFFSQLINENLRELPKDNPELKYQCLLLMDEFTLLGRVGIIEKTIGIMAGYNIRPLLIFQSKGQIENPKIYGKESARNILTNCALQIFYAPREQQDANEYAEMLGYQTAKGRSISTPNAFASGGGSRTESENKRYLLMPQEVKEIGEQAEIVSLENCKPILAEKIRYYEDEVFKDRANMPCPPVPKLDMNHVINSASGRVLKPMDASAVAAAGVDQIANKAEILASVSDMLGFDLAALAAEF
jgi:type IV secretion system protein VirD4